MLKKNVYNFDKNDIKRHIFIKIQNTQFEDEKYTEFDLKHIMRKLM